MILIDTDIRFETSPYSSSVPLDAAYLLRTVATVCCKQDWIINGKRANMP